MSDTKTPSSAALSTGVDLATPNTGGQLTVSPQKPPSPTLSPRQTPKRWIWAGLVALFLVAATLWYVQPWASKGLAVTVETATPAPLILVLAVNGRLAPQHLVAVKPTAAGTVTAVLVEAGAVVQQGEILAQMDASGQQAQVRQAIAGLDAGLAAQAQAEANLARAVALGGNITRTALGDARTAQQTATQEVARLTALLDQAQIGLEKYTIAAPVAGKVLSRNAEVGQVVDVTTALFSIADLGKLVVETDVDEGYAARITLGLPAVLQLKGDSAKRDGRVSFVAAQVDAATGGLAVKIAFDDPVAAPVGLTVTANIIVETQAAAIAVPRAAVITDATGAAVFVAVAGRAVRREVSVVDWPADRVQVTSGLAAGDVVIIDATGLLDGLAISVPAAAKVDP
ncbi:efflux RND transporter periplasmic adaptor subunit [Cypionkella psychrotolerans]|uniref:efflux RND transporter periplasmic adaptor subunit n=1 Tax=Cypionkella psychrotolerans TaxID=1678131 RepID=UPI0006B5F135|nr:efflux RND transporter periplasmic adaptor subunit [Cypionkella psychrotolerans]